MSGDGGHSEVSGQTQTTSLSVPVNADKELPSPFSGLAFHPSPPRSLVPPSCHTILPPSGRPQLDLALDCLFDRIRGATRLSSAQMVPSLLSDTDGLVFHFSTEREVGGRGGDMSPYSGSCGGPWGRAVCETASPPGQLRFPLLHPGERHVWSASRGGRPGLAERLLRTGPAWLRPHSNLTATVSETRRLAPTITAEAGFEPCHICLPKM